MLSPGTLHKLCASPHLRSIQPMVPMIVQVPPSLKEEAERLAASERRSVSNWLRNVVADRIEAAKAWQQAAA